MNDIIIPRVAINDIADGEMFDAISSAIRDIMANKLDKTIIKNASDQLSNALRGCFGIDTNIGIIDESTDSTTFYGINVFPGSDCIGDIQDAILSSDMKQIREIWQTHREWIIEIDGRLLFDYSLKITEKEVATLLLVSLEQVIFNYANIEMIATDIFMNIAKMNYVHAHIVKTPALKYIWSIPITYSCAGLGFVDIKRMKNRESIIFATPESEKRYCSAIQKITARFGTNEIVNVTPEVINQRIRSILNWIFEGIANLKYSSLRFVHKLKTHAVVCRSPYIRMIFHAIIQRFVYIQGKLDYTRVIVDTNTPGKVAESSVPKNPLMEEMNNKMIDERWKKFYAVHEQIVVDEFIDRYGYCKKVTREELDMIVIELDNIETPDDKVYLMARLYKTIGNIDAALEMLNDSKMHKKVKQSKQELSSLRNYAESIRDRIIAYKFQPEGYGLFVKYPKAYEG
jgi:hypothetical protein